LARYRLISQCIWDDKLVIDADDFLRTVWFALLTGPAVTALPGLLLCNEVDLAAFLRRDPEDVRRAFLEFSRLSRIETDPFYRLIRVINAPKHNPPQNQNVIRCWWSLWQSLPESQLKYNHIASLRESVPTKSKSVVYEWDATFGGVAEGTRIGQKRPFQNRSESVPVHDLSGSGSGSGSGTGTNKNGKVVSGSSSESREGPETGQLTLGIEERRAVIQSLFEHYVKGWVEHVRVGRRPILDAVRSKMLHDRLDDFSAEELRQSIDGLWTSTWHIDNRHTGIETVMRDVAHVEKFLARVKDPPAGAPTARAGSMPPPAFVRDIRDPWREQGQCVPRREVAVNVAPKEKPSS
jgi:hypothetical protein